MTPLAPDILHRDGCTLVFGMEWFPLLGEHQPGQARALGRRRRATHCVLATGAAASVGLWRNRAARRKGARLCSAAAAFAALHPVGTVAAVLLLPDGRRWLVAVHEGAVMTRADQLHNGQAGTQDAIACLREAHPAIVVHDETCASSDLLDALFESARESGALQRLAPPAGLLRVLLIVALLPVVLWFVTPLRQLLLGAGVSADAPVVDPVSAWRAAVADSARPHAVHGVAGLKAALDTLHGIPVFLAGWRLARMECRPGRGEWHCQANYRRKAAGDNQGFIDAALPGWSLSFDPMEGATAAWPAAMPALPLNEVRLHDAWRNEAGLVSALQAVLPAFSELRLGAAQPLPVSAPLDARQLPVPRPEGMPAYQRRSVQLQAPLRSLSVLLPETVHMSWDRIVVELAATDQPSLRSSSLRASLSGVLYETDDPHRSSSSSAGPGHGVLHGGA